MNLSKLKVLLADDDTDDCIFFKEAVVELIPDIHFNAVHDGEQLMHWLTNKANELPHVLFLDLNMPRKNGFECLAEIKQNETLKQLPVIMFSTSFEQLVVNQLYQNGAHYFIRKPSEFSQFKKIIQQTLKRIALDIPDYAANILQPAKEDFVITVQNNN